MKKESQTENIKFTPTASNLLADYQYERKATLKNRSAALMDAISKARKYEKLTSQKNV